MTEQELLAHMLDRLSRAESAQELFGADEIAEWPVGAFEALAKAELLRQASPARVLTCMGCEQYCSMLVNSIPRVDHRPARIFIACDKRDDVGRVPVEANRLRQWQFSGRAVAEAVAKLVGFARSPQKDHRQNRWVLGTLQGTRNKAQVALAFDGGATLLVAGHNIPLAEALTLGSGAIAVNRDELVRCADNPIGEPGTHRYSSSVVRREARKLGTQQQYQVWQKEARRLRAKAPKPSERWIAQHIAKLPMAQGATSETIRKRIRPQ
jgi:hypothetical protein